MKKLVLALAMMVMTFGANASVSSEVTQWLRCAFSGVTCLPAVQSSTSTSPTPKQTTTHPWIKNK